MKSMELQYVPATGVLRLVARHDGDVLAVEEMDDSAAMSQLVNRSLRSHPEFAPTSLRVYVPGHVCMRVWTAPCECDARESAP